MSALALAALVVVLAFGAAVACALFRRDEPDGGVGSRWLAVFALAPGLGYGLLSLLHFGLLYARDVRPWRWHLFAGMAALVAVAWWIGGRRVRRPWANSGAPALRGWQRWCAIGLVAGTAAVALWIFSLWMHVRPEGDYDAVSIWSAHARLLYGTNDHYGEMFAKLAWGHRDYPLLLPCANAAMFSMAKEMSPAITQGTSLVFFLATPLLGAFLLRQLGAGRLGAPFAALLLATPTFIQNGQSQQADVPIAYFLLGAVGCLASAVHSDPGRRLPLPLGGFFLGCLPWLKNDGWALAIVVALAFVATLVGTRDLRRGAVRSLVWVALGALAPVAATVAFKLSWAQENDLVTGVRGRFFDLLLDPARWTNVASHYWTEITTWSQWGALWPVLLVALACGLRRAPWRSSPPLRFLFLAAAGCALAWFLVYVVTPVDQDWHMRTSMGRLIVQILAVPLLFGLSMIVTCSDARRG